MSSCWVDGKDRGSLEEQDKPAYTAEPVKHAVSYLQVAHCVTCVGPTQNMTFCMFWHS